MAFTYDLRLTTKICEGKTGGGTQNQTGVHGFADTPMISNSIFYNVWPCIVFDVLFAPRNSAANGDQMASSGKDSSRCNLSGIPTN